ncbi:MAG TPA: biotin--[acetyl-CoA-carboxylase] ligase [Allosphingosinicella sp.]
MIRTVAETGSTNDDLAVLAREGAPEGSWLRAERQTSGRGRQGRAWASPPGNLYASTLVRLRPGDPAPPTLALVAAVAVQEVASAFAPDAELRLKWPNDLFAGGRKLAGILLERQGEAVVIGFGVNLAHHPEAMDHPAASFASLTRAAPDPAVFAEALADGFARWLGRWRNEGLAPVRTRWLAVAHPSGTALSTHGPGEQRIEGLFEGLDETGALRLRLPDGTLWVHQAGDVFLI